MRKRFAIASAVAIVFMTPTIASAQPAQNFGAHLTGAEEVPARDTLAQGQATFKLESPVAVTYRLIASNIDNVVAAHIHCGEAGTNGGVVQFLFGSVPAGGGSQDGILATGTFDPSGKSCGTSTLLEAMRAGKTYVNVHTNDGIDPPSTGPGDFQGGEIRGQIRSNG